MFRASLLLLICTAFGSAHADEKPLEVRPDWRARGNITDSKTEFAFTVDIATEDRSDLNWGGDGWTEIRALMTPSKNRPSDTESKLAFSHSFRNDLGYLGRPHDAWPSSGPRRVVFPPAHIDGKDYFLPIHGHLFQCGKPFNDRQPFDALSISLNTTVRHAALLSLPFVLS